MINSSINEVAALARKAARGAGYSWSMADEAAFATAWLSRRGIDGAMVLANHLTAVSQSRADALMLSSLSFPFQGGTDGLCALSAGASLTDIAGELELDSCNLQDVISPALLLPYIGYLGQQQVVRDTKHQEPNIIDVRCKDFSVQLLSTVDRCELVTLDNPLNPKQTTKSSVSLTFAPLNDEQLIASSLQHRAIIDSDTLAVLESFAARIYAPATEASRQGAGAGVTDSD